MLCFAASWISFCSWNLTVIFFLRKCKMMKDALFSLFFFFIPHKHKAVDAHSVFFTEFNSHSSCIGNAEEDRGLKH